MSADESDGRNVPIGFSAMQSDIQSRVWDIQLLV